ncbi:MAG: hypothetical protein RBR19_03375 [Sedimentisphaerales bacterium]|nr:hypothetical protein [Sedimentisphaerales bacterium]
MTGLPEREAAGNIARGSDCSNGASHSEQSRATKPVREPLDPGKGDSLAAVLMGLSGWQTTLLALGLLILGLVPVAIAACEGDFLNPELTLDAFHDIGYWNQFVIGLPGIFILLAMYFGRLPNTVLELMSSNTFVVSDEEYATFKKDAEAIYAHPVIVVCPYAVSVGVMVLCLCFYTFGQDKMWYSVSLSSDRDTLRWLATIAGFFVTRLLGFLFYYALPLAIVRIIATFFVLRKFFRFPVSVQPLHPDACGGLSPLGALSRRLNRGTFFFGIISVLGVISNIRDYSLSLIHPIALAIILAYIVAAFIAFFLPLFAAHRRMKDAKYETVSTINQRFQQVNQELLGEIRSARRISESRIAELESLRKVHEIASRMPVYPFNATTISSFLGTLLTPFLILVLDKMLDMFL